VLSDSDESDEETILVSQPKYAQAKVVVLEESESESDDDDDA
jgi:hypothetical protein